VRFVLPILERGAFRGSAKGGALMTRTLVMTIDRDDDLGVKAGIRGPVIGRKQTLTAALRLGIADPEESDTNAILGALHHHDQLVDQKEPNDEVEIAILTGDERVGLRSDRAVAAQLEEVISEFQPDCAILVTDGAEDEAMLPIITSRVRIDHVEKIIVRQSKGIEGTYYYIMKAIDDPKWRAKLLVPLSIFLLILGLGMILPQGNILIGAMPLIFGIWLLAKGLGAEAQLERLMVDMRESAAGGIVSSLLWALASIATLLAILEGWRMYNSTVTGSMDNWQIGLRALDSGLQWIVVASLSFALSMIVLRFRRGTFTGRGVQIIAFGAVLYAFAEAMLDIAIVMADGQSYELDPSQIYADWRMAFLAIIIFWAVRTGVRSWSTRQESQGRYWGI